MVKPGRVLLLLVLIQLLLLVVVFLFPQGKIGLYFTELRFLTYEKMTGSKKVKLADISHILLREAADTTGNPLQDALIPGEEKVKYIPYKLQFPEGKAFLLANFFRAIDSIKTEKNKVRIMHYGDSQIEGDRISSVVRDLLQDQFGGSGPGLLPITEPADVRNTVKISHSENWKKFAIYGGLYKGLNTKNFGILGSIFRFYSFTDSNGKTLDSNATNAWVNISRSGAAYRHSQRFDIVKLLYGNVSAPVTATILTNTKTREIFTLEKGTQFSARTWQLDTLPNTVGFNFSSYYTPDIYGISLEGKDGILLDNVAMRGSSGTDFTRINPAFLSKEIKALGVRLLILQFGVNVVPYIKENFEYYEKEFYRQLKFIRDNNPGVAIIVIGTSDMAMKEGTDFVSYPNIEGVRDAQRRAAFKAGCAYWDLYQAMGGKNSMISWVNEEPALAEKDYTHFNYKGSKIIGEMIYKAIMNSYYTWKKHPEK